MNGKPGFYAIDNDVFVNGKLFSDAFVTYDEDLTDGTVKGMLYVPAKDALDSAPFLKDGISSLKVVLYSHNAERRENMEIHFAFTRFTQRTGALRAYDEMGLTVYRFNAMEMTIHAPETQPSWNATQTVYEPNKAE